MVDALSSAESVSVPLARRQRGLHRPQPFISRINCRTPSEPLTFVRSRSGQRPKRQSVHVIDNSHDMLMVVISDLHKTRDLL